jgi:hypothetical protein
MRPAWPCDVAAWNGAVPENVIVTRVWVRGRHRPRATSTTDRASAARRLHPAGRRAPAPASRSAPAPASRAIAWVVPEHQISLTAGVMQAFNSLLTHFGLPFAVPLIAVALAVGALAGMMAWLDAHPMGY